MPEMLVRGKGGGWQAGLWGWEPRAERGFTMAACVGLCAPRSWVTSRVVSPHCPRAITTDPPLMSLQRETHGGLQGKFLPPGTLLWQGWGWDRCPCAGRGCQVLALSRGGKSKEKEFWGGQVLPAVSTGAQAVLPTGRALLLPHISVHWCIQPWQDALRGEMLWVLSH